MPELDRSLTVGDEVELEVTNIAHGGVCVARHDGRVVFVADAIPGERVLARVTESRKKSFARAVTVRVLEASPHRREHVWQGAAVERDPEHRVGGAEFGHIALEHQRQLKAFVLEDSLKRMAGIERAVAVHPAPGDDARHGLGYRTRVRLHVDTDGRVGPYTARSNTVIQVQSLPLASPALQSIAPLGERMPDVASVNLVDPSGLEPGSGDPRMLLTLRDSRSAVGDHDPITEQVGQRTFHLDAGGFWQVHREAAGVLSSAVSAIIAEANARGEFDPAAHNIDLYGGVGLLAAAMGDGLGSGHAAVQVTSVEADARASDYAAENLSDWLGARAVTSRVDRYLSQLLSDAHGSVRDRVRAATVILDPPRSGAGGDVTRSLVELAARRIIYVACDPVALARDLATLTASGYALESLEGYDLFPHTHHVEAIAVLERITP